MTDPGYCPVCFVPPGYPHTRGCTGTDASSTEPMTFTEIMRLAEMPDIQYEWDYPERNPLLKSMEDTFGSALSLAEVKNHDYAGAGVDSDPLKNFRRAPDLAGVSLERGILVRLSDKLCRLSNILESEVAVGDERLEDTIIDAELLLQHLIHKPLRLHPLEFDAEVVG